MKSKKKISCIFISLLLFNCSQTDTKKIRDKTDIEIYKEAISLSSKGNHAKSTIELDKLIENYPYSKLSSHAEIMAAYSLYENNEIEKAIIRLNSFIELNPVNEYNEYAHYLLAMCYYIKITNEGRDPSITLQALNTFKTILIKYPRGKYAKDSTLKIQFIENKLALNELSIGVFYLHNNAPGAAIKRFKSIIENYKNSNLIPETLYRLCEAFLMIGLETEAKKSQALLIYNFSDSKWKKLSINLFNTNKNDKEKGIIVSIKEYVKTIFD
jgi:outer membrane protein assembly factor BamD|tara:strand:+ start:869 stop:1678 length:810 start_codon:yes stop_codon:yes gene_type:complete